MNGIHCGDIAKLGQEVDDAAAPDFVTKFSQLRIDSEELSEVTQGEHRILVEVISSQVRGSVMILVEEREVVWSWDVVRACEKSDAKASGVG